MTGLPRSIRLKLDEVRETLRSYLWWKCLLMIGCWVLLIFWLGAAIDYLPVRIGSSETPRWVRIGLLITMAGGSLWFLLGWLLPRWLTRIRDSSLALLIENHHPHIGNELVTAIELSHRQATVANPAAHEAMLQKVLASAGEVANEVDVRKLFNWVPIRNLRWLFVSGLMASCLGGLVNWEWFSLWSQRLLMLSDQPWPRQAILRADFIQTQIPAFTGQLAAEQQRIEFKDDSVVVPIGAPLLLQVSADATARQVPEVCTLYYRSEDGTRGRANLRRIGSPLDGWQQFQLDGPPLDGVNSPLVLDVIGLDARLRNLTLKTVDRVVITDLQLECQYPSYLLDSLSVRAKRELLPYRSGLQIPEGTQCTLIGHCNTLLREVQYTRRATAVSDSDMPLEILQASIENGRFRISLGVLRESQLVEIRLTDQYSLSSEQVMRYNLIVVPDLVPEIESRLEGIGLAMTPRAYLPIRGTVVDDHAVAEVFAEVSVDESSLPPVALQLDDKTLGGEVDFLRLAESGVARLQPGMTVGMSVVANDYYDLDDQPHSGRGQTVQLAVVTEDQLLVLLDRNELELRQRLEQIISELSQLSEALRSLADLLLGLEPSTDNASRGIPQIMVPATSAVSFRGNAVAAQDMDSVSEQDPEREQANRQAAQRMSVLRAQQAQLQTDKSRQELAGVVNRVEHLRLQLVHNRIDSLDRQQRLLEQVQTPLNRLLAGEYVRLEKLMSELQSATMTGKGRSQAGLAAESLDKIVVELEAIKSSMIDIESFNELIDLVRGLLEEQERVLRDTEETQKNRILDLLR